MQRSLIILPTHLFVRKFDGYDKIYIVEEPLYFTAHKYHKLKLCYHRATMREYYSFVQSQRSNPNLEVNYIEFNNAEQFYKSIIGHPAIPNAREKFHTYDPIDRDLRGKFADMGVEMIEGDYFILRASDIEKYKKDNQGSRQSQAEFYKFMRRKLNILMNKDGEPVCDEWSFDTKNRDRYPSDYVESAPCTYGNRRVVAEAIKYVKNNFSGNYGAEPSFDKFIFPTTREEALSHLDVFVRERLKIFGKYEDSFGSDIIVGSHSCLSSSLNFGLITPFDVIERVGRWWRTSANRGHLADYEGFIRQLIGWREYVKYIYCTENLAEIAKHNNIFGARNELEKVWWLAGTMEENSKFLSNIPGPLADVILKIYKYSWAHHIERLMIVGAFMLMCGVSPSVVYEWFLTFCSIDAYPWVMEPNIYGMSQWSVGDVMMRRPYFSSSNYLIKMRRRPQLRPQPQPPTGSESRAGSDAELKHIWDTLYWGFIHLHRDVLSKVYAYAAAAKATKDVKKNSKVDIREYDRILSKSGIIKK